MQSTESFMTFLFGLGIITIILGVINAIQLIIGLVKKYVSFISAGVIILSSITLPYCLALSEKHITGNKSIGTGINTFIVSGFVLMVVVSIYLNIKRNKHNSFNHEKQG